MPLLVVAHHSPSLPSGPAHSPASRTRTRTLTHTHKHALHTRRDPPRRAGPAPRRRPGLVARVALVTVHVSMLEIFIIMNGIIMNVLEIL